MNDTVRGVLTYDITSLSNDVLTDWDSSYPVATFPACKFFGGSKINQESNRQIHRSQFHLLPHIVTLVNYFEGNDKTLSIDQVWLIRKSESEEGFQRWHRDLPKLEGERSIVKTIVVNLGHTEQEEVQLDKSSVVNRGHTGQEEVQVDQSSPSSVVHVCKTESQMTRNAAPGIARLAIDEAWKWHEKYTSLNWR
jgi:hypothetical protein